MALYPLRIASFCSGVGGLDLGVKAALGGDARTVLYVEGEAFAAACLVARMQDARMDSAPIWSDIKTLESKRWRGHVDCIIGGYPCQPWSLSGKRRGASDPRHLWPHIARHVESIRPAFVFCENVPGHLTLGFEQVCEDLCRMDYRVEAGIFSAEECGAPHQRKRLFFLAHTDRPAVRHAKGLNGGCGLSHESRHNGPQEFLANADNKRCRAREPKSKIFSEWNGIDGCCGPMANTYGARKLESQGRVSEGRGWPCNCSQNGSSAEPQIREPLNAAQSRVGRTVNEPSKTMDYNLNPWADGWETDVSRTTGKEPFRIDRLRALGNAVVPATAALAWRTLVRQAAEKLGIKRI